MWSIGLTGEAEQSLYDLPLGVAITQHARLPSLNVGVAGAVACFEVARQRAAAAG